MWESNITVDLTEMSCEGLHRIQLSQDWIQWPSFVNTTAAYLRAVEQGLLK